MTRKHTHPPGNDCDCGPQMSFCGTGGMKFSKMFGKYGSKWFTQRNVHQTRTNGDLVITVLAPGIKKDTIKIRAKPNKMTLQAERKPELIDIFGKEPFNIAEELGEEVIPDKAKAKYSDGVLTITFPLENPGYEVSEIDYD